MLENLARRELKKNMPVEEARGAKRASVTHLEATTTIIAVSSSTRCSWTCWGVLKKHDAKFAPVHAVVLKRARRYAEIQERLIAPDGSFPAVGRSIAYLPFQAVHTPIRARPDLVAKYERKQASAPPDAWGSEGASKVRLVQNQADYAAMLEQMDTAVGRMIDALERNGLAERTVVVFMSDNGGLSTAEGHPTSNLPLRGGKGWLFEGGIREPMIIRAPGVTKPGGVCETPVISTDFYPTLLELTGLPLRPQQHVDGMSLVPLLKGEPLARSPIFWHYPHYGNQGGAPGGAVRDGDWKLIEWDEGSVELYNLASDLEEKHNLAAENPAKLKELQTKLAAWRKQVGAVMPTSNPNYDPNAKPPAEPGKKKISH